MYSKLSDWTRVLVSLKHNLGTSWLLLIKWNHNTPTSFIPTLHEFHYNQVIKWYALNDRQDTFMATSSSQKERGGGKRGWIEVGSYLSQPPV